MTATREVQRSGCQIFRSIVNLVRRRFTKLPVKRSVIISALAPIYGNRGARLYMSGFQIGYLDGGLWMSGKSPYYSMGLRDGWALKEDSSAWPQILGFHLERAASKEAEQDGTSNGG